MGTYNIPRETKGEGRLFYIFSTKALIYTVAGILIGALFRYFLLIFALVFPKARTVLSIIGMVFIAIFAVLGFVIGTFKVPSIEKFEITKKAAGQKIDKVLIESIKFKINGRRYYTYNTDALIREDIEKEDKEREAQAKKEEEEKLENERNNLVNRRGYIRYVK